MKTKTTVVKLGGSLVLPKEGPIIDFKFLYSLKELLEKLISEDPGRRFILIVGGGKVCRDIQNAAREGGIDNETSLNRIGIAATNIGAEIVHSVFREVADTQIIRYEKYFDDLIIEKVAKGKSPIVIGCGSEPKYSTDTCAVMLAEKFSADKVISLKDVDGVYSEDPRQNGDAKVLGNISWDKYIEIIDAPDRHLPGANLPIDVVAAKKAKKDRIYFMVLSGKDLGQFECAVEGEPFNGTKISN